MKRLLRTRWGGILATLSIGILIVVIFSFGAWRPVQGVITTVFAPVQQFFHTTANRISGIFEYFGSIEELREQNEELKHRVDELTVENVKLKNAVAEGELIQEAVDYITEFELRSITGRIIGRSASENYDVLIVNKGSTDGVREGYPVITGNGILIGRVIVAQNDISKILTLTDNHSEYSAYVKSDTNVPGVVSGKFGISLHMELIPQDESINEGDIVVTSGLEENIPANLVIGSIATVHHTEGDLFKQAVIDLSVSYSDISIVNILIPFDA